MTDPNTRFLAWFLGPKAEAANLVEDLYLLVLRDYFHWRRNYFPGDRILIDRITERELEPEYDAIFQRTLDVTAQLRRNFPFYSPRYIAHQLSETSIPSMIGFFAGALYNPNNVTPEAAPVTVGLEIDACSAILEMIGYTAPPPLIGENEPFAQYQRSLSKDFGWAHISPGGTTANIEALWVAKSVKYFPLAVRDVAEKEGLEILVRPTDTTQSTPDAEKLRDLRRLTFQEVALLKPGEAIYLMEKYLVALRRQRDLQPEEAAREGWEILKQSEYSLANGTGKVFSEFPPVIFASGAQHYSVAKAADVLGIGSENVTLIDVDSTFRMDTDNLEQEIRSAIACGKVPLAVVCTLGTTEEGAVDPLHRVVDLRSKLEQEKCASFWIHGDAAWGGFIRSLFVLEPRDELEARIRRLAVKLRLEYPGSIGAWQQHLIDRASAIAQEAELSSDVEDQIGHYEQALTRALDEEDYASYERVLREVLISFLTVLPGVPEITKADFNLTLKDRVHIVNEYVRDRIELGTKRSRLTIQWGSMEVTSAFLAMPRADSITIDPHKLGYVPYPCGVVAFKRDRVRHFVRQSAPYITAFGQSSVSFSPPRYSRPTNGDTYDKHETVTEAFGPFILEGSRPGAAATGLWMSVTTMPLNMKGHGSVIRSSLLAARELHAWLTHWGEIVEAEDDVDYEFVPITSLPPDTNLVCFCVRKKTSSSLQKMNSLTLDVYRQFTIESELGELEYSYSQPFFLSRTKFDREHYSERAVTDLLERCHIRQASKSYSSHGIMVLRATVMNPYIYPMRQRAGQDLFPEFMRSLDRAAC